MKKFYGLTGTKLNIAIAVIAGIDFALFGYGKLTLHPIFLEASLANETQIKVLWAVFLPCPHFSTISLR
jgi:hypothetical protein